MRWTMELHSRFKVKPWELRGLTRCKQVHILVISQTFLPSTPTKKCLTPSFPHPQHYNLCRKRHAITRVNNYLHRKNLYKSHQWQLNTLTLIFTISEYFSKLKQDQRLTLHRCSLRLNCSKAKRPWHLEHANNPSPPSLSFITFSINALFFNTLLNKPITCATRDILATT